MPDSFSWVPLGSGSGAAGAAVNAVRGGNAQVTFKAQVQSGPTSLPIKVDQLLNFSR